MKTLSLVAFFLVALSPLSRAQPVTGPIEEMDQGSCWIQKHELDGKLMGYQIASFGSGNAFRLFTDEFGQLGGWVTTQLKTRFGSTPSFQYEASLYCYSSGHFVTIQVDRPGQQPVCLHAKAKDGINTNDLELVALRPDSEYRPGGACYGIEERSIGLSLKSANAASVERIRAAIANNRTLADIVESVEYRDGGFFAMAKLKESYAFREVEAKAQLEASPLVAEEISSAWLNGINLIAGEERALFQGVTDAY